MAQVVQHLTSKHKIPEFKPQYCQKKLLSAYCMPGIALDASGLTVLLWSV
jgi:hypothetical protein